jgi:hypothetical protein
LFRIRVSIEARLLDNIPTIEDYRWLTSGEAVELLSETAGADLPVHRQVARLRRELPPARAHLVLEQVELRRRAQRKFRDAGAMFFTRRALEQSTDQPIARHKATRFGFHAPVFDLCCGIGGDLLELSVGRKATGVERDPATALLAQANLRALGRPGTVAVDDAAAYRLPSNACWHIDPDRRPQGRRTTRPELHEPGPETIDCLRRSHPGGALKLAPAAAVRPAWAEAAELEWISHDRECRQLVVWFGHLARIPGKRRATALVYRHVAGTERPEWPEAHGIEGVGDRAVRVVAELGPFIFEPDAAVLAAGLSGELAARHGLASFGPPCVYLTGGQAIDEPLLAGFEVEEILPPDLRRVGRVLRERKIGKLEIKARGPKFSPEKLRSQLKPRGDRSATLIVTTVGQRSQIILARRLGKGMM